MPITRNKQRRERLQNGKKKNVIDEDMKLLDEFAEENKKILEQQNAEAKAAVNEESEKKPEGEKSKEEYPLNDISHIKNADEMVAHMAKVYQLILAFQKLHPEFEKETDKKKVDIVRDKLKLDKIIEAYPIVTRYIICFGQFSEKAFRDFLRQCEKSTTNPAEYQKPGARDDKWCQLQANYVTLLWKEYNKHRHPSEGEKKMVWNQTYQLLKKTFTDMKSKQKDAEKLVKEEKQAFIADKFKDYLERLKEGKQKIEAADEEQVRLMLEHVIYKGKMKEVFNQLKEKVPEIEPQFIRAGRMPEHEAERRKRATIKMTEYVDAERMHEIPDKYKPEELKGMEMVPIEENNDGIEVEEWIEEEIASHERDNFSAAPLQDPNAQTETKQ